ncbi:MAG: PAS domain-containing protein, partial [Deltaproteobacteria bacterium]|nr:PAS domain-containing protein [Deltaproteobacteria bacterium]
MKITLLYLLMGIAWTFYLSDIFHASEKMKDLYFLSGTTLLIYGLINHSVKTVRRSEEALKGNEKRLNEILETNPCGVVLLDKEEVIAYANPAASGILGVKRSQMIGRHYKEIGWEITQADGKPFSEEDHPGNRVLREERNFYDVECAVALPGRKPVILSFNSAPLRDAGGGRPGTVVAFIDITERRKA